MFNLLIADDEQLERRAIKSIVSDRLKGVFDIYEAKNGREAIEIADKIRPEVIIMDIKMPGINGIEAIKEIKKFHREGYFIILTAYDYFWYAKEAIEVDVKEYLLKPLKRDELIEKLEIAVQQVEEIRAKRNKEMKLREKVYTMQPIIENQLCYTIINNDINENEVEMLLEYLNMQFKAGYSMLLNIDNKLDSTLDRNEIKLAIKEYIKELIQGSNKVILSSFFTADIVMFIEMNDSYNEEDVMQESLELGNRLVDVIKEKFGVNITIGIGRVYRGIDNLNKSYDEAAVSICCENCKTRIKHYEDIYTHSNEVSDGEKESNCYEIVSNGETQEGLISKAVEYIKINYNSEITLEEVSGYICISSYYFSKIFKEVTGKNYVDYITELRIEKAKEMLKSGAYSIKDICFEVGYNDPNYFSRVFKKVEGVTPSEFKIKSSI